MRRACLPWILCAVHLVLQLALFANWQSLKLFKPAGDEPHYMVMADAIAADHAFENTRAYQREFQQRKFCADPLSASAASPASQNKHVVEGPHGLYNKHNLGLPLLIAVPELLMGVAGAKLLMILLSTAILLLIWCISACFTDDPLARMAGSVAVAFGYTLLVAGNQIYPDIPAGGIILLGLWYLLLGESKTSSSKKQGLLVALAVAFLPWLHIKQAAPALILCVALCMREFSLHRSSSRASVFPAALGASCLLLACYNYYAFGHFTGPYIADALVLNGQSATVFFGLLLDRHQGMFLENPFLLVSLYFLPAFIREHRLAGITLLACFASIVVPNAMHPAWYGGWSFGGRFEWAAALLFAPIALFAATRMLERGAYSGRVILLAAVSINAFVFWQNYNGAIFPYNQMSMPKFRADYLGMMPRALWKFLPAFTDHDWAFAYAPNLVFILLAVGLVVAGVFHIRLGRTPTPRKLALCLAAVAPLIFLGGVIAAPPEKPVVFRGRQLPTMIGNIQGDDIANRSPAQEGLLTYGPYVHLQEGAYKAALKISANAGLGTQVGRWEVSTFDGNKADPLPSGPIIAQGDEAQEIVFQFDVTRKSADRLFEIRTYYGGTGSLKVQSLVIEKIR